ncbi:MAG: DUF441 domain-containing protein [Clostridiales bacterium]|nr:DUF441 domain-containing protein [Clostridiales bacterium]
MLMVILLAGLLSRNAVVAAAAAILLLLHLGDAKGLLHWVTRHGLTLGYLFLLLAVLAPLLEAPLTRKDLLQVVLGPASLVALLASALGSWLAYHGVRFMDRQPQILLALVLGTVVGTVVLRGVPTGPLIAAGFTALLLELIY